MKRRIRFYTFGCKTNQYETQAIKEDLIYSGPFDEAKRPQKADLYLINTCTVTAKADRECRNIIRRCHRENPGAEILVTGCLTEMDRDMIRMLPGVSLIIKNKEKNKIKEYLINGTGHVESGALKPATEYTPLKISTFNDRTKAYVKVQDGCDNRCSYCKVPLVRGRSRSRNIESIKEEVHRLLKNGFKELVLTGICLGDWGRDLGRYRLHDLVKKIDNIEGEYRIRLSSIEPKMVTEELIDTIKNSKRVCRHLHIPLQSGSNHILKLMKRPYSAKEFVEIIRMARRSIQDLSITTDVMVGFPGERDRNFRETLKVIHTIGPSRIHIFSYSKRGRTAACGYDGLPSINEVKKRRLILENNARLLSHKYRKGFLNKKVECLVETKRDNSTQLLTGYSDTYIRVLFPGPDSLMGRLVTLKVSNVKINSTFCSQL